MSLHEMRFNPDEMANIILCDRTALNTCVLHIMLISCLHITGAVSGNLIMQDPTCHVKMNFHEMIFSPQK